MRRPLAAVVLLATVAAVPLVGGGERVLGEARAEGAVAQGCTKFTTRPQYASHVRVEYREPYISRVEIGRLAELRRCARTARDRVWMVAYGHRVHRALAEHRVKARYSAQCADRPTWRVIRCIRYAAMVHGADLGTMMAIASCESGFDPKNVNSSSGASGVFQFILGTWRATPIGRRLGDAARFSARHNSLAAAALLAEGGRSHWVC